MTPDIDISTGGANELRAAIAPHLAMFNSAADIEHYVVIAVARRGGPLELRTSMDDRSLGLVLSYVMPETGRSS